MKKKILLLAFFIILLSAAVLAQSDLPIAIQKIIDYNKQSTIDFSVKVSFFIAFIAGILGLLSPCILPFLPAYFSYTFKEKKNITKMTIVFFIGFSIVFMTMGVIAGFIGERSLLVIQKGWLVTIAGIFLIILGGLTLFGRGFSSFIKVNRKFKNDIPGVFLFGVFFAIGWTACLGPILAGILGIGALLGNIFYSAVLLLFYSLGNLVPLFILAVFYDKWNLSENKIIKGKMLYFGESYQVHSTNLISGLLFLGIGIALVIFKGTSIVNSVDLLGTTQYFYSMQRLLINWEYANLLGILLFFAFILFVGRFLWKTRVKNETNNK